MPTKTRSILKRRNEIRRPLLTAKTVKNLHFFFAKTKYGKILKERIRYERYKPGHFTNQDWVKLLGPDVNNFDHALFTYELAKQFISQCNARPLNQKTPRPVTFGRQEAMLILLAAIIHDWGEAAVGDIISDLKTNKEEKREMRELRKICQEITGKFNPRLKRLTNKTINEVITDQTGKLGQAFNAIEHWGYMHTALNAWRQSQKRQNIADKLQWLTVNVICYIDRVIFFGRIYPPIHTLLVKHKNELSAAFANMPKSAFQYYHPKERKRKIKLFNQAKKIWQASEFYFPPTP